METIGQTIRREQVLSEQEELSTRIKEAHSEIEFLRRRLERLAKLQSLLKDKYHSKLDSLSTRLSNIDLQEWELENLAKQLKGNKDRQSVIKEQIGSLERRKKTPLAVIRQIAGYKKSSNARVEAIEEEQEILSERIHDLESTLELVEQAELNEKELEIVVQRIYARKGLLEEHTLDLTKRTIDLLFDFYIPPKSNRRLKL
jgi:chromosome segregation ATPase